jgi:aerobic carbon-monoxide dehydrogenase medium subunit
MKPAVLDYARPSGLPEAVALRAEHGMESLVLAGGQSLIPMLNFRIARPGVLIDLNGCPELAYIEARDGGTAIGAMTRQRDLELDAGVHDRNPLVRETLHNVAHGVVRNRGTVGGSIAHADAAAELPALFTALEGRATVAGPGGERVVAGQDLFLFHMTSALEADELLREVWLPDLPARTGYAFLEYARRHGDYAVAGVCAVVTLDEAGAVADARLGYAGVASRPMRARDAEQALAGRRPDDDAITEAARAAEAVVEAADSWTASQAYRRHLVNRLTVRALRTAAERAEERSHKR